MKQQTSSQALHDKAKGVVRITGPIVNEVPKMGRNEPCWCGSGLKYKKCCLLTEQEYRQMDDTEVNVPDMPQQQQGLEDMDVDQLWDVINEGEEE